MEVLEAITARRSIRRYLPDEVTDENLRFVLEAARWAPSWSNTQCWRFVVVKDPVIKARLAEILHGNRSAGAVAEAPLVIVLVAQLGKSGFSGGAAATDKGEHWYMFDAALAMQNLVLEAYSLGLGTVIIGKFDAQEVARLLQVAPGFCVVAMTPLGYPAEDPPPRPRLEIQTLVSFDRFISTPAD